MSEHACWMLLPWSLHHSCPFVLFSNNKVIVIWWTQQFFVLLKSPHPIISWLFYEGVTLVRWLDLMIQCFVHPCWSSVTSDNNEAVLISAVERLFPHLANIDVEVPALGLFSTSWQTAAGTTWNWITRRSVPMLAQRWDLVFPKTWVGEVWGTASEHSAFLIDCVKSILSPRSLFLPPCEGCHSCVDRCRAHAVFK